MCLCVGVRKCEPVFVWVRCLCVRKYECVCVFFPANVCARDSSTDATPFSPPPISTQQIQMQNIPGGTWSTRCPGAGLRPLCLRFWKVLWQDKAKKGQWERPLSVHCMSLPSPPCFSYLRLANPITLVEGWACSLWAQVGLEFCGDQKVCGQVHVIDRGWWRRREPWVLDDILKELHGVHDVLILKRNQIVMHRLLNGKLLHALHAYRSLTFWQVSINSSMVTTPSLFLSIFCKQWTNMTFVTIEDSFSRR